MRIGNDSKGYADGSIIGMSELEIEVIITALQLAKIEIVCDTQEPIIHELAKQFSGMLGLMRQNSQKGLDIQDEGWYNGDHEEANYYS